MIDDKHLQLSKGGRLTNVIDDENNEALLKFSAYWQVSVRKPCGEGMWRPYRQR